VASSVVIRVPPARAKACADLTFGVACEKLSSSVLRAILIANRQRTTHYEGATVQELGQSYWCLNSSIGITGAAVLGNSL
jgi:hypothetical protein